MPFSDEEMDEIRQVCPGAREIAEGGISFVYLPGLKLPCAPGIADGLLCTQQHSGYSTRLFLSLVVPGKGVNWAPHVIVGRTWHSPSWNGVTPGQRPAEILAQHLRSYR